MSLSFICAGFYDEEVKPFTALDFSDSDGSCMTSKNPYVLYADTLSGSIAPEVMLKETGADYQLVNIDMAAGEHREPAYLAINPAGQVPALKLPDGAVIGESAAMMIVLGERHPSANLTPAVDSDQRAQFIRWIIYMAASPYMSFVHYSHPERYITDTPSLAPVRDAAMRKLMDQFAVLEDAIAGTPYFLPGKYSALDIYLAMLIEFFEEPAVVTERFEKISRLYTAVSKRPHYMEVMSKHRAL